MKRPGISVMPTAGSLTDPLRVKEKEALGLFFGICLQAQ